MLAATQLRVHLLPPIDPPYVDVVATYPGASAREMETLVARPIEEQLLGIAHGDRIAETIQNESVTFSIRFLLDTDLATASADVQRRVEIARAFLPSDLAPPHVLDDPGYTVLDIAVTSRRSSDLALSDAVRDEVVPVLRAIPGISNVSLAGARTREFHVYPDRNALALAGATAVDVVQSIAAGSTVVPGGRFSHAGAETSVSVDATVARASDLAALPLAIDGTTVSQLHVGDVAGVEDGVADERQPIAYDGRFAVELHLDRAPEGDTLRIVSDARAAIAELARTHPLLQFHEISTSADHTRTSVLEVIRSLLEGVALTAIAMLFFLHAWRNAIVVALSIPLSVLAALIAMDAFGITVDLVSMLGLGLSIGILVDDSIVVLENITRHRDSGEPAPQAALAGRREIGAAAFAITAVDVIVFLPLAFVGGQIGKYLHEFAIVVVVATAFSLLVSFTLVPMLAGIWSLRARPAGVPAWAGGFTRAFESLRAWYARRALPAALDAPITVLVVAALAVAGSIALPMSGAIGTDFVPFTPPATVSVSFAYPDGVALERTRAGLARLARAIRTLPGVVGVVERAGTAEGDDADIVSSSRGDLTIVVDAQPGARDAVKRAVVALAPRVSDATVVVGSGSDAQAVAFSLTGPQDDLDASAARVAALLRATAGARNVRESLSAGPPSLVVHVEASRAAVLGIAAADIATTARIATGGALATRVRTSRALVDVRVLADAAHRDQSDLARAVVRGAGSVLVPLRNVTRMTAVSTAEFIKRVDGKRVVTITADLAPDTPLGNVVNPVERALAEPGFLPSDVHAVAEGDVDLFQTALAVMRVTLVVSAVLVFLLLVVLYKTIREPLVILTTLPLALVGALGGLALRGQTLNLFSLVAIVMLFGLVAKNAILLIDNARVRIARGQEAHSAMIAAGGERFRPIVMTVVAMVLGMVPLSLSSGEGVADRSSMGTVLIGGLLSSLFLTLVVVPIVYVRFARRSSPRVTQLASSHSRG